MAAFFVLLVSLAGSSRQAGPLPGLEFAILDPGAGFGETGIQGAHIAHPIAQGAAVRIEFPCTDHDLVGDVTFEAGAEEQEGALVFGRGLDRPPCRRPKRLYLRRRPPAYVGCLHARVVARRPVLVPALGTQFIDDILHLKVPCAFPVLF